MISTQEFETVALDRVVAKVKEFELSSGAGTEFSVMMVDNLYDNILRAANGREVFGRIVIAASSLAEIGRLYAGTTLEQAMQHPMFVAKELVAEIETRTEVDAHKHDCLLELYSELVSELTVCKCGEHFLDPEGVSLSGMVDAILAAVKGTKGDTTVDL